MMDYYAIGQRIRKISAQTVAGNIIRANWYFGHAYEPH